MFSGVWFLQLKEWTAHGQQHVDTAPDDVCKAGYVGVPAGRNVLLLPFPVCLRDEDLEPGGQALTHDTL